ncbi:MAG: class I SAM-dependent methyltransferase [Planctomycetota bacterium]
MTDFPTCSPRLALFVLSSLLWSCGGAPPTQAAREESSVKPGINQQFLEAKDAASFAQRFETESREIFSQRDQIVAAIGLKPGQSVADVGAGTGLFLESFATAVGSSGKVYAVDLAPAMVAWIGQRIRKEGWTNVSPVRCSERSVELPPDSVDVMFVCDTYHHFEYPQSTLATMFAALRSGGELVIVDFHRIEGTTRTWILEHVRAGEDVVRREIETAGFQFVESRHDLLVENWFARYRKP